MWIYERNARVVLDAVDQRVTRDPLVLVRDPEMDCWSVNIEIGEIAGVTEVDEAVELRAAGGRCCYRCSCYDPRRARRAFISPPSKCES